MVVEWAAVAGVVLASALTWAADKPLLMLSIKREAPRRTSEDRHLVEKILSLAVGALLALGAVILFLRPSTATAAGLTGMVVVRWVHAGDIDKLVADASKLAGRG